MKLNPDILRMNAQAMLALADGKEVEYQDRGGNWRATDCVTSEWPHRPKPWQLPAPPAGRQWHRTDWTEEMLPVIDGKQTRPLLMGEVPLTGDTWRTEADEKWQPQMFDSSVEPENYTNLFHRTTRPLPSEPVTRPWSKPEDVPPLCWVREGEVDEMPLLVTGFLRTHQGNPHKGCGGVLTSHETPKYRYLTWAKLAAEWQYSTDRKEWKPCTVTEAQ